MQSLLALALALVLLVLLALGTRGGRNLTLAQVQSPAYLEAFFGAARGALAEPHYSHLVTWGNTARARMLSYVSSSPVSRITLRCASPQASLTATISSYTDP